MVRVLKLATPHWVNRVKRNNQLLLCEAPKGGNGDGRVALGWLRGDLDNELDPKFFRGQKCVCFPSYPITPIHDRKMMLPQLKFGYAFTESISTSTIPVTSVKSA